MIYFIYGEDSYRSKIKLKEIVAHYKEVHKSGLNLVWQDVKESGFKDLIGNFRIASMFDEKKLIILKNVFASKDFQEDFLKEIKTLNDSKHIVVIFEKEAVDERGKLFKALKKDAKCQEFSFLAPAQLKAWVAKEFSARGGPAFGGEGARIEPSAIELLLNCTGSDLWHLENEIKKLCNFRHGETIKKEDVFLMVRPKIENDIFKTIDAIAQRDKKEALDFLKKHIEAGDSPLYLLSMFAYQFKNLLIIKELMEKGNTYALLAAKSRLHPFVVKKTYYLCNKFSLEELKNIYKKIFQMDLDIKTGKVDSEMALDLFIASI